MGSPLTLVVGKFLPLHKGHELVVDRAIRLAGPSGRAHVFVNDRPQYAIPAEIRAAWVQETFPATRVHIAHDPWAATDAQGQANNILRILGRAPDVIVTSEDWADPVSELLGCSHVRVDPERTTIPMSATQFRDDPVGNWSMLVPAAKAGLTRRICVVGAESTGKTTLCKALSERWSSRWIPEYGRDYTIDKQTAGTNDDWSTDDFVIIANRQQQLEDSLARRAASRMPCDTDAMATAIWHERYQGHTSPEVEAIGRRRRYDLFVLCGTDVPWTADDIRLGPAARDHMQQRFREELSLRNERWIEVTGSVAERIVAVETASDSLLTPASMLDPARWN